MSTKPRSGLGVTRVSGKYVRVEFVEDDMVLGTVTFDRKSALRAGWTLIRTTLRKWR